MISDSFPLQGFEGHIRASEYHGDGPKPAALRMSVAISRETGTRGPAVAQAVGVRLGWPVYDHELLEMIARNLHVRIDLLESIDERHISWLTEIVQALGAVPYVKEAQYVRRLIEALLSLAERGNCVVVGRGSPFVMPPDTTLRVRLYAPLADRVANVREDLGLTEAAAAAHIEQVDRARIQFVRSHFLRDPVDARHYDLVINLAEHSIEECADLIVEGLATKTALKAASKETRQPVSA